MCCLLNPHGMTKVYSKFNLFLTSHSEATSTLTGGVFIMTLPNPRLRCHRQSTLNRHIDHVVSLHASKTDRGIFWSCFIRFKNPACDVTALPSPLTLS